MTQCTRRWLHSGRTSAGRQWMLRQSQDAFVAEARRQGYIARSAFKLLHLDDRFGLFHHGVTRAVVDLGCSPGGWCQVIRQRCGDGCVIFGVDLLPVRATVPNAVFLTGDFTSPALQAQLLDRLGGHRLLPTAGPEHAGNSGKVDVVTSDMCPNRMGGAPDRQRITALNEQALGFALPLLRTGGHFVCKALGSTLSYEPLHHALSRSFLTVRVCKPPASRQRSDEAFLVGLSKLQSPRQGVDAGRGSIEGGGRYGLDDWPGFARTPARAGCRRDHHPRRPAGANGGYPNTCSDEERPTRGRGNR